LKLSRSYNGWPPVLKRFELDFHFHISFTDPAAQLAGLIAAADDHNARALVFGNGVHQGYFVLTSIRTTAQQMSANGDLIAITVRAALKEWPFDSELNGLESSGAFPLIGIVAAPPGATTGAIVYSGGSGVSATVANPVPPFVAPLTAAPGVSAILNVPGVAGLTSPQLSLGDVPPSVIVRTGG